MKDRRHSEQIAKQLRDRDSPISKEEVEAMNLDRASVRSLGIKMVANPNDPEPDLEELEKSKAVFYETLNRYLRKFADAGTVDGDGFFVGGALCVCGEALSGVLGTFTYGMAHGEGRCDHCKWPARANHYVTLDGDEKEFTMTIPMPYHPSEVTEAK